MAVLCAVLLMAVRPRGQIHPRYEGWASALVGVAAGFMGGISSLTGPVLITYLMALHLKREEFIGSISIIYLFGGLSMYGAMLWYGRFSLTEVAISFVALAPMFLGLKVGASIHHRLSEGVFRGILLTFLTALALVLLAK